MAKIQASGYSPTIKKRALSRKLVELREQCGMTTSEVCKRLHWSPSKLNYIEKAKWVDPNSDAVADLCELYGVSPADTQSLIELTREARQRGWWRKYNNVFRDDFVGLEAGAAEIRTFESVFIPGLLQVPGYIQMVTRIAGIEDPDEIGRHVDARLQRQKILTRRRDPSRLKALIDENALLRISDREVLGDQVQHLIDMSARLNIDIQVLTIADGIYPGTSEPFVHLRFPDPTDRDIIYLETTVDDRMLEEKDELARYMVRFDRMCAAALDPVATYEHLTRLIE
ncbi:MULTISPECIES: helix-turn-helix domain-containing protein [Thermomonosporaceae]|uniref:helix-turn-helix domain-containing protein n=1 Tax=Thermomonosporaceae TaxID=2012 RepID=UPI00255ADB94|nr:MULTISPECIES: helix-turn-helix transcriptional regulator [Thermomonosporaceae]MDL4772407.1 helix-turn-helix transcriptional regulator [Actinomadura xylanilytica]